MKVVVTGEFHGEREFNSAYAAIDFVVKKFEDGNNAYPCGRMEPSIKFGEAWSPIGDGKKVLRQLRSTGEAFLQSCHYLDDGDMALGEVATIRTKKCNDEHKTKCENDAKVLARTLSASYGEPVTVTTIDGYSVTGDVQ